MTDLFNLKDRVAVITGGSGVLGREMSAELARRGVRVAILGLHRDRAENTARQIVDNGGDAIGIGTDVLQKDSLMSARDRIVEHYGRVDILINGAGGNKPETTTTDDRSFPDLPDDAMKWVFNLNLLGTVLTCQVFLETMMSGKAGSIINLSSMATLQPLTRTVAY